MRRSVLLVPVLLATAVGCSFSGSTTEVAATPSRVLTEAERCVTLVGVYYDNLATYAEENGLEATHYEHFYTGVLTTLPAYGPRAKAVGEGMFRDWWVRAYNWGPRRASDWVESSAELVDGCDGR